METKRKTKPLLYYGTKHLEEWTRASAPFDSPEYQKQLLKSANVRPGDDFPWLDARTALLIAALNMRGMHGHEPAEVQDKIEWFITTAVLLAERIIRPLATVPCDCEEDIFTDAEREAASKD